MGPIELSIIYVATLAIAGRETTESLRLLHRKPQGRKISSDNRRSGEPARLDGFAVIRFR